MAGEHRAQANGHRYREAKARFVRRAEPWCGVCGAEVDKALKWPDPDSPSVDHIIPLAKGGDAMDTSGWQLAHLHCNRAKSDRLDYGQAAACPRLHCPPGPSTPECPYGPGYHWPEPTVRLAW
ncbi:HNH endonuclease [Terrabacter sp. Root181]|uniref:HNH endonuclease n=1 Tax=Terrabacter sp. Root181 TaxID=1736484 RepID=UPI0007006037|nr:HNH endonuclease signature motif containing protein [Terrabacter sp. Root181]KRB45009.1 hypothetical protein ASD90_15045 [Terrabacter sp. Root181]